MHLQICHRLQPVQSSGSSALPCNHPALVSLSKTAIQAQDPQIFWRHVNDSLRKALVANESSLSTQMAGTARTQPLSSNHLFSSSNHNACVRSICSDASKHTLTIGQITAAKAAANVEGASRTPIEEAGREGVDDGRHRHSPGAVVGVGLNMQHRRNHSADLRLISEVHSISYHPTTLM